MSSFIKNFIFKLNYRGYLNFLSDKAFLKLMFRIRMKKKLNLKNPQTYNEKLQWLKLYDRNDEYSKLIDKYEVKKHVSNLIGEEYIIKTLGIWDSFDDIDFSKLPDKFVLKCTHDSGGLVICEDKEKLDINATKEKIENCLKKDYYTHGREWVYKNVSHRIIAEEYMKDSQTNELRDYKFFTFDGEVKAVFIATDRQAKDEETKFDFYDAQFNHLPFTNGHPNADIAPVKPKNFEKMKELASILSKDLPHVRVDFYEVDGKIYFGEITFFHWSGMVPFEPEEWDYIFGSWIKLPKKR